MASATKKQILGRHFSHLKDAFLLMQFKYTISSMKAFLSPGPLFPFGRTSLVAQMVKHLPTVQESWVRSLGRKDPLEKEMATHSSTLAWKIPWTEEHGRLQSMGSQRVRHDQATSFFPV